MDAAGKLTLQGALRYDHAWSYYPAQQIGPTRFLPTPLVFPETQGVIGYNDIDPRFGVAYDLFGNGKTALKFNVGRYLEAAVGGNGNYSSLLPSSRITTTVTRTWTDANGNFTPDCDLNNPLAQDLRTGGGDFCGADLDQNFGKTVNTLVVRPADPPGLVQPAERLDHRRDGPARTAAARVALGRLHAALAPATSRSPTTGPQAVADYTPFSVTAPLDPRLPGGGGYVVSGLYNVVPDEGQPVDNYRTYAPDYGTISQMYNGIDINVAARLRNDFQLQAGTNTGQRVTDYCAVRAQLPEQTGAFSTGSEVPAFSPDEPLLPLRAGDRHASHRRRHLHDPEGRRAVQRRADQQPGHSAAGGLDRVERRSAAQSLGRPLSSNAPNVVVNLLKPGRHAERSGQRARLPRRRRSCGSAGRGRTSRSTCSTR